jgi:rSAM/selenodomain-associated transferase 2
MIGVTIPTLNAAETLPRCLAALVPAALEGLVRRVVVVDGGSTDATLEIAEEAGAEVLVAAANRGAQLASGCEAARTPWLLALHADTVLAPGWSAAAARHMAERPTRAGWFRFRLDDRAQVARVWEAGVAARSGWFGLPYGDQGLLISRALYEAVGGYRPLPLMEDVDLVRRLGRARLAPVAADAVTSAARFRRDGYLRRSARNWALLARWATGADPARLAAGYTSKPLPPSATGV